MPEFGFDDWIDAQLRSVPLPPNLLERLSEAGPGRAEGHAQLDSALRDVAVPLDLQSRLRRIPRISRRGQSIRFWRQLGLAASLLVAIGLGTVGIVKLATGVVDTAGTQVAQTDSAAAPSTDANPGESLSPQLAGTPGKAQRSADLASRPTARTPRTVAPRPADIRPTTSPATDNGDAGPSHVVRVSLPEQSALGADGALDRLPDLEVFDAQPMRGVSPPLVRGYDLLFELRYGEHPFVSPAAHQSLAATTLPFTFDTESFDAALEAVRGGHLPAADEIRVEDFLAAQGDAWPEAPRGGLALHVAGSESPLEGKAGSGVNSTASGKLHLLELAVQAASYDVQQHYPNRLIVALDTSSQMRAGARLMGVRHALAKLAQHMDPRDRVTLLGCADQAAVIAADATPDELKALAWSDALPEPSGSANLAATIRAACSKAREIASADPRQVVVISGDRGNYEAAAMPNSAEQLGELAQMNISWRIVRVAADERDARWNELAEQAQGKVVAAHAPDDVYASLLGALTGWPETVADDVTVTLTFNPQEVLSYRLLGHEATTLTGVASDPVTVDLHADQTAADLYEVALRPGTGKLVASVEVTWRHPPNGQPLRIVRPILRDQLSGGFFQAPAWFQEGVVAAKGAESLRGSYYAPTSRGVTQVLELAARVDPSISAGGDFGRLVELLKTAEKLH